ncbi:hypothetical protein GXW74_00660 [Roseomonas eburnea]|uniref:Uncharacterized protein n=1 Tax=Neoroseomonas eburnea TaxID=1346889 RepID=A0A9X9X5J9_9PROT|nr:hypothetical protein [Neoroseomonas eburnea]MBR0678985.1 hypothetical protein [Neoroseomonas eburnea]
MLRRFVLAAVLAAAACAPAQPPPTMPSAAMPTAVTTDPITQARQGAASFFRAPQAGQPAQAARAIANMEYLAEAVPADPVWQTARSSSLVGLAQAKNEGRRALGIPASAPSQAVIDGLLAAATALEANDRAGVARALPSNVFTAGPDQTVRRLSQPPRIPSASGALAALSLGPGGR